MIESKPTKQEGPPSIEKVRSRFPALASGFAFLENAGGSQLPQDVIDSLLNYLRASFVQLGAGYPKSVEADETVAQAHSFAEHLIGADGSGCVILGASTTTMIAMLAHQLSKTWREGDEIIVAENNHEANAGPWHRLQTAGMKVKVWPVDSESLKLSTETLTSLLTDRTRLVAFPHVSNLLGAVEDVKSIVDSAHAAGAKVFADGVAFAPHRRMRAAVWGVDFYAFSFYKVYAPHIAALWGTKEALEPLESSNHFFFTQDQMPHRFEPGGVNHEACAGVLGLRSYLKFLAAGSRASHFIDAAFDKAAELERLPQRKLLDFLHSKSSIRIFGSSGSTETSVPTVSFVSKLNPSSFIAAEVNKRGIGIRNGHMYALRLTRALGLDDREGVVRVSLVHYNTIEEIERLISILEPIV